MEIAINHHDNRILRRIVRSWHSFTRQANTKRVLEADQESHRAKMAALLHAAATKAEKERYSCLYFSNNVSLN